MIGFYNRSVILTYIGLLSSLFGITQAAAGAQGDLRAFKVAFLCLIFSGFCDMFDGKIARHTKRSKDAMEFGIQIDSLCDLICFGVFPAFIVICIGPKHWIKLIAAGLYVLGAVIRLGYFNVMESKRQQETTENRKYYQGLPVTTAALIYPLIFAIDNLLSSRIPVKMSPIYVIMMFITGFLFVWDIKVKKPGRKEAIVMAVIGALIVCGILVKGYY